MNKHTNGPWRIDEHLYASNGTIWGPDGMKVCSVEDRGGETRDNANLIAAAPELLEALSEIADCGLAVLDPGPSVHGGNVTTDEIVSKCCESGDRTFRNLAKVVRMARAAIAKARGAQ